jgi:hypothetical protein
MLIFPLVLILCAITFTGKEKAALHASGMCYTRDCSAGAEAGNRNGRHAEHPVEYTGLSAKSGCK